MSRYLIDTNILSEPIRPQPTPIVVETMRRYTNDIAIASITWHEIFLVVGDYLPLEDAKPLSNTLRRYRIHFQFCLTPKKQLPGTLQNALDSQRSVNPLLFRMDKLQRSPMSTTLFLSLTMFLITPTFKT
jgi:hypothetical protein